MPASYCSREAFLVEYNRSRTLKGTQPVRACLALTGLRTGVRVSQLARVENTVDACHSEHATMPNLTSVRVNASAAGGFSRLIVHPRDSEEQVKIDHLGAGTTKCSESAGCLLAIPRNP